MIVRNIDSWVYVPSNFYQGSNNFYALRLGKNSIYAKVWCDNYKVKMVYEPINAMCLADIPQQNLE